MYEMVFIDYSFMAWFAGLFIVHNFSYTSQESLGAGILGIMLTMWILPDGIEP